LETDQRPRSASQTIRHGDKTPCVDHVVDWQRPRREVSNGRGGRTSGHGRSHIEGRAIRGRDEWTG